MHAATTLAAYAGALVLGSYVPISAGGIVVRSQTALGCGGGSAVTGNGSAVAGNDFFGAIGSATRDDSRSCRPTPTQTPEEILEGLGCAGVNVIIGECDVPVPCGAGESEIRSPEELLAGRGPDSLCPDAVTNAAVLTAFREVPLPEAVLTIQPPDGETLVNFATNFYTIAEPFSTTVALLGHSVELSIYPSQFVWSFGDGTDVTTTSPGAPYPDLEITHSYTAVGEVTTQVTTTWAADFRVDGGLWQTVTGTVDMTSSEVPLVVREGIPLLID